MGGRVAGLARRAERHEELALGRELEHRVARRGGAGGATHRSPRRSPHGPRRCRAATRSCRRRSSAAGSPPCRKGGWDPHPSPRRYSRRTARRPRCFRPARSPPRSLSPIPCPRAARPTRRPAGRGWSSQTGPEVTETATARAATAKIPSSDRGARPSSHGSGLRVSAVGAWLTTVGTKTTRADSCRWIRDGRHPGARRQVRPVRAPGQRRLDRPMMLLSKNTQ